MNKIVNIPKHVLTIHRNQRRSLMTRRRLNYVLAAGRKEKHERIIIPKNLLIKEIEGINFICSLDEKLDVATQKTFCIDFSSCESIDVACAVSILSSIQRFNSDKRFKACYHLLEKRKIHAIQGIFPKNTSIAHKILTDINFYKLLNADEIPPVEKTVKTSMRLAVIRTGYNAKEGDRSHKTASGSDNTRTLDEAIKELIFLKKKASTFSTKVVKSLKESLLNVADHAYEFGIFSDFLKHRWWMIGSYNPEKKSLNLVFLDRGCGIPCSIEAQYNEGLLSFIQKFSMIPSRNNDPSSIKYAISEDITRTLEPGRGKGLKNITSLIKEYGGTMKVVSGRGMLTLSNDGLHKKEDSALLTHNFKGTMLIWSNLEMGDIYE